MFVHVPTAELAQANAANARLKATNGAMERRINDLEESNTQLRTDAMQQIVNAQRGLHPHCQTHLCHFA